MKKQSAEIVIDHIRTLMREQQMSISDLQARSKVSRRMLVYILDGERTPSLLILDRIAAGLSVPTWMLLLPTLPANPHARRELPTLVENFLHTGQSGRYYVTRVAEKEARYDPEPPA